MRVHTRKFSKCEKARESQNNLPDLFARAPGFKSSSSAAISVSISSSSRVGSMPGLRATLVGSPAISGPPAKVKTITTTIAAILTTVLFTQRPPLGIESSTMFRDPWLFFLCYTRFVATFPSGLLVVIVRVGSIVQERTDCTKMYDSIRLFM